MVVISATSVGFFYADKLKKRCDLLTAFLDFLCNLETNIRYSCEDIFSLIKKSSNSKLLNFFKHQENNSITEYWSVCVKSIPCLYGLTKEDYSLLNDIGINLGTTDVEGQISHIQLYSNLLITQLEKARNEYSSKSKLYKLLGFFLGCGIVLMII